MPQAVMYKLDPNFRITNCEVERTSPVVTRSMRNISKNEILAKVFCLTPKEVKRPNYFESELSEDEQEVVRTRKQKILKRRRSVSGICRRNRPKESIDTNVNNYADPSNTPKKLLKRRYTLGAALSDGEEICLSNGIGNVQMYNNNSDQPNKMRCESNHSAQQVQVTEVRCALSKNNNEYSQNRIINTDSTSSQRSRTSDKVVLSQNRNQPSRLSMSNVQSKTSDNNNCICQGDVKTKVNIESAEDVIKKKRSKTRSKSCCCDSSNRDRGKSAQSRVSGRQSLNQKSSIESDNKCAQNKDKQKFVSDGVCRLKSSEVEMSKETSRARSKTRNNIDVKEKSHSSCLSPKSQTENPKSSKVVQLDAKAKVIKKECTKSDKDLLSKNNLKTSESKKKSEKERLKTPSSIKDLINEKQKESSSSNKADCAIKHHHQSRSRHREHASEKIKRKEQTESEHEAVSRDSVEKKLPTDKSASKERTKNHKAGEIKRNDHSSSKKDDKHKSSEKTKYRSSSSKKDDTVEVRRESRDGKKSSDIRRNRSDKSKAKTPTMDKQKSNSPSKTPTANQVSDRTRNRCSRSTSRSSNTSADLSIESTDNLPELIPIAELECARGSRNAPPQPDDRPYPTPYPAYRQTQVVNPNFQSDIRIEVISPQGNLTQDFKISVIPHYHGNVNVDAPSGSVHPGINQLARDDRQIEYPPRPYTVAGLRRHSSCADTSHTPHLQQPIEHLINSPVSERNFPPTDQSSNAPAANVPLNYLDRDPRSISQRRRSARLALSNAASGTADDWDVGEVPAAAPEDIAQCRKGAFSDNEWEFAKKFCENIQNYIERTPEELMASMFEVSGLENNSTDELIHMLADNAPPETLEDAVPVEEPGETPSAETAGNKTPVRTEPSGDMEHYKKRLIHQMENPKNQLAQSASEEDLYGFSSSAIGTCRSSCSNLNDQESKKKETVQSKIVRKRSVCRSKYRHESLELFKLGASIPTSLCKSKESYTISAEKNLQMCQQNGGKLEEPLTKVSITDHIISSMDVCRKKELLQISASVRSDKSTDSSSNSIPGRHQLPPIISEIPGRRKNKVPAAKATGMEPRPNGQRTRSVDLSLPDFMPRKQIVSRRQTVISTENIGCGRTAADGSEAIASQDIPINLSLKRKETEVPPRTNVYEQHATCSVATFPEIHQQISRMETPNEYRVEDFRNSITTSIIRLVRSVMEENSLTVQVILILNEWFRELHRVMNTVITTEQMKSKIVEALNEVVNYLCCHIFGPGYPYKCKVLIEEFIQIKLQPHADLLRQTVPLLAKAGDRYEWMRQLTKLLNVNSSRSDSPVDTNARSDAELDAPNRDELASRRIAKELPSGIANESHSLIANELPNLINNELPSQIVNELPSRIPKELPSQFANELPNRIPHAHKPQKKLKKMVETPHNSTDERSVRIAHQSPPAMGNYGTLSRSIEHVNLREPPAAVIAQDVERPLDVNVTQANTVLEQMVEVRDTSMEVTKEVAVRAPTATADDVVVEKVQEDADRKEDVKDFKFDLNDFQQMYMQTSSRKKLRQLMHMLKEDHFEAYQKVMEKFSAVTDPHVKEVITIDDDESVVVVQSNAVPEPTSPATTTAVTSPKRKVEENAKTSLPKKVKIRTETAPKAKTGSSNDKDLNQNYVTVEQSVIVQQKRKKSPSAKTTAHPPPPPPVIEDISSEEDTTPRPFCDMTKLPLPNDLSFMNEKSSPGNIVYAKAMPPHPPPAMPSCSKLKTHPPYYKPRVIGNKSYLSPESIIAQRFPHTPERLRPTTPEPRTQLPVVKPGVNWKSWMSEERRKSFFGMQRSPVSRRQSIETISSVGSDYSPKFSLDDNFVEVKIDSKWYRIKKRLYERIPKGKLCYIRETNTFVRYFDDAQMEQFVKNLNVNVASAITSDLMKQIRCRKGSAAASDTFVGPRDASTNNEVIHVAKNVTFCPDDKINDPEMYVQEVEKVEEYVPVDFLGFYKFVTGYQIIHNHPPISFQTFLIMHNTNGIRDLFKKYVNSLIEGRTLP